MEMCYDGALVMPSNYAVMDEEEMMYLDGGVTFTVTKDKCATITSYITLCLGASAAAMGTNALRTRLSACIGTVGRYIQSLLSTTGGLIGVAIGAIAATLITTNGVSFAVGCVTADRKDKACKMTWYGAAFGNFKYV